MELQMTSKDGRNRFGVRGAMTLVMVGLAGLALLALAGCTADAQAAGPASRSGVALPAAQVAAVAPVAAQVAEAAPAAPVPGEAAAFAGTLNSLPSGNAWEGNWQVGGQTVRVGPSTQIDERKGKAQPGARLAVEGWTAADGSLNAGWVRVTDSGAAIRAAGKAGIAVTPGGLLQVSEPVTVPTETETPEPVVKGSASRWITETIHPVEYRGIVQVAANGTLTGTWTIGGHVVNVGPGTDLKLQLGKLEAGAYVQVIGWLQPDGTIDAAKILVKKANPGKGHQPPTGGITNTIVPTSTLPAGIQPGSDDEDDGEAVDQNDGNNNWDIHLHGPVAGSPITTTAGVSYTLTVNGQQVIVDASTWVKVQREFTAGDWLQVKGLLQPDGSILATSIQWVHRVPSQPGNSASKNGKNGKNVAVTPTPVPGMSSGQIAPAGGNGKGQGSSVAPGKSPGKAATRIAPAGPGNGNGSGNGNGNGNGNGHGKK